MTGLVCVFSGGGYRATVQKLDLWANRRPFKTGKGNVPSVLCKSGTEQTGLRLLRTGRRRGTQLTFTGIYMEFHVWGGKSGLF